MYEYSTVRSTPQQGSNVLGSYPADKLVFQRPLVTPWPIVASQQLRTAVPFARRNAVVV